MAPFQQYRESLLTGRPFLAAAAAAAAVVLASCSPAPAPGPPPSSVSGPAAPSAAAPSAPERPTPDPTAPSQPPDPRTRPLGWGPQQQDADAAAAAVAAMTPEEKAGQVILPFFTGTDVKAHARLIGRLHLAGSIIMGDNVPRDASGAVLPAAMKAANQQLAKASGGRPWPGLIAVDQEGGSVSRLGAPLTEWPSPMSYGAAGSGPLVRESAKALGSELAQLGYNADFAPAADVTIGPRDPTIGARSFSADPAAAGSLSVGFSRGLLDAGVLPVTKHFPGHGSVTADSHRSLPVQGATRAQLEARDWKPFRAAIAAGVPMVMTGHIAVPALQPGVPASLSKATYRALRGLGFDGVAVTDALNMSAVHAKYPDGSAAVAALAAGADLLLMPADAAKAHAAVVRAVKTGALQPERLDEAAVRVATMMHWRGRTGAPAGAAPGHAGGVSSRVSAAAITVLAGPCRGPLVPGAVRVSGGTPRDRALFSAASARAGLRVGSGPVVNLVGFGGKPAQGDIAVALDAPWAIAASPAPVKLALYGRTPGAFDALAAVLAGKAPAPGKLPAAVGRFPAGTGCPTR